MGGNAPSISKNVVGKETHMSARNVLERYAEHIKKQAEKAAERYENELKGKLEEASFSGAYGKWLHVPRYGSTDPCGLYHKEHTNLLNSFLKERDPCDGRNQRRFDENEGFECGNDKIIGNSDKYGSCAPPRRRHICDKNLEAINVHNTKNSNDLLGNILVTAKYEGESIVKNHPNRGSSEVCIALARSFADIGDIIRGRDLYGGNNKRRQQLEENLRKIFGKIYEELTKKNGQKSAKDHYKDATGNYIKLREDWWTANRDQVWKALTCFAHNTEEYFIQLEDGTKSFTNPKCGHDENNVITNLDYVPQFLRWFTEWAEEFCRIRKIKLGKVKNECRGETSGKRYCSGDGYDCTKTDISRNIFYMDLDCPRCEEECTNYNEWIENKENELDKQKNKYTKEIEKLKDNSKSNYDKNFYLTLTKKYGSINLFLDTLKEGSHCSYNTIEDKIDFNKANQTFTSSKFCGACPFYGVKCNWKTCTEVKENEYKKKNKVDSTHTTEQPTAIDVLVTHNRGKNIPEDLKKVCQKSGFFKGIRNQKWTCEYKNQIDECKVTGFVKDIDVDDRISFKVLFERWLKYFIQDFNNVKDKINRCTKIEKGKDNTCIKGCKHKCECVEKWIKIKEVEWDKINQHYKQNSLYKYSVPRWVNSYLTQKYFSSDFINALEAFDNISSLKNLKEYKDDIIKINKIRKINVDLIKELISKLKEKCAMCKTQHKENKNNNSCKTLPPHPPLLRRGVRSVRRRPHRRGLRSGQVVRGGQVVQVVAVGRVRGRSDRHFVVGEETVAEPETAEAVDGESEALPEEEEEDDDSHQEPVNGEGEEANGDTTVERPGPTATPVPELPGPPAPTQSACEIVKVIFNGKSATDDIQGCRPKENYQPWNCTSSQFKSGHNGACMPPRRQKLCVINLKTFKEKTSVELRNAFIKCAAIETHFLWKYYKEKNNVKYDKILESGYIPEDFKRMMYYTFGDYRDLCLDKDIGKDVSDVENYIKGVLTDSTKNGGTPITAEQRKNLWKKIEKEVWDGMLCALSYNTNEKQFKDEVLEKLMKPENKNTYSTVRFSGDNTTSLEEFAKRPQFLRWFTEWSDEFCREREKKENAVQKDCKGAQNYDGCDEKNKSGSCANACNEYKKYITGKKTQYESQEGKFNTEKRQKKPGYENYSNKNASQYLKENCLFGSCSCMDKVKEIPDYWEKPHKTYDTLSLQKKCSCPPSPCTIVDAILGDKSSMGYREGCKTKYMTRGLEGWLCNDKKGEGGKEDGLCIPPRRQRLYVKDLENLIGGETTVDLREAFIKCAAVETFFSWHEYKQEEIKEEKEQANLVRYISSVEKELQMELKKGEIPDGFLRQMFYTFGDYRDIFFKKDIGRDMEIVKKNINKVFENGKSKTSSAKTTPKDWWKKYGPDIWEGMLCALSYNTESKIKDESLCKILTEKNSGNKNTYDKVKISSVPSGDTTLEKFSERPTFFRWLEEWAHEFCTKRTYKLKMIKEDCGAGNNNKNCDDDGFDCDKMCPNKNGSFETFYCLSCAKSCRFYKKWINTKKSEFDKQEQKYQMEIKKLERNSDNIYDEKFIKEIPKNYNTVETFLENLKNAQCSNNNNGNNKINFNNKKETFGPAKDCKPCSTIGFKCIGDDSSGVTENGCNGKTFNIKEHSKNTKNDSEEVGMLVSDNSPNQFPDDLNGVCSGTGIFTGIKENKWTCGYVCGLDICSLKTFDGEKDDKQNILIRALFKRWLESFLEDYNKINDKISHCMKKDEGSQCINQCENKCKCVNKWIEKKKSEWGKVRDRYMKRYKGNDSDVYEVRSFLEQGPFHSDVQKAIKPFEKLINFEDSSECNDTMTSEKKESQKKDVVECLLDKLLEKIKTCQNNHKETPGIKCSDESPPEDTPAYVIPPDVPPPFCNVPANPCGDKDATNVVGVEVVAEILHQEAKDTMVKNSVVGSSDKAKGAKKVQDKSESVLKGDISKATFKNKTVPSGLNRVCDIKKEYTNDTRGSNKGGPCTGKDNDNNGVRMKIGTPWKTKGHLQITDPYLFLPPRREHICTSNLEKIHVKSVTDSSNVNDSFLWDVVLAAKLDAEKIKDKYINQNEKRGLTEEKDKATVCRAIRYSFADLGDIIRGKDLWEHKDFKDLQTNLVTIFGKIKQQIADIKENYADDTDGKHTKFREDWWEANRAKVWEAMKCAMKNGNIDKCNGIPIEDYIPQRLRWMTEWAEWYCKVQKKAYEELEKQCRNCRNKGKQKCINEDGDCKTCKGACEKYEQKIKKWEEQWTKIKGKYEELYQKAEKNDGDTSSGTGDTKDENDVVAFLSKLHKQNIENNIYATAAGYIHQEAKYLDCNKQNEFCEKKNGDKPTNGEEKVDNEKYAFKHPPHEYEVACKCETNKKPEAPPPQPARPPAARESGNDDRGRSERGDQGQRQARPPPAPRDTPPPPKPKRTGGGGAGRSLPGRDNAENDDDDEDDDDNVDADDDDEEDEDGDEVEEEAEEDDDGEEEDVDESESEDDDENDGQEAEAEEDTEDTVEDGEAPQEPAPPQPPAPAPLPPPPPPLPPLKTALMSSTIMWSIGIGFAAFTYFYLKEKRKRNIGT
ncbi:hypothetical protein PFBG_06058 [Plasmodium falciparum 7G8]|uniref:Erythrocyte membrane protein 1 n=4 Tax=Plasmodium falciparum TaxID=5833 RepID=W7FCG5_PLAF8|nr:hypothetical protein PFBG_06058 [Plasmodium falciparum 7G8]